MKLSIKKNSVQETLLIPLYGRHLCTQLFPSYYKDPLAKPLMDKVDYDFSALEGKEKKAMYRFGILEIAMRQNDLATEVKAYLDKHPEAAVVNLGCGLDHTGRDCDNGRCRIYNIDMPDVIETRNILLPPGEREENLAFDLNDQSWMDRIDGSKGVIFFAAGVFYYFKTEDATSLFAAMAERFPGGRLVFDACGPTGVKMMLKTWIKEAGITDVGAYLSVKDAGKLARSHPPIRAASRPYMRGYKRPGKDVSLLFRMLSYIGDEWIGMKIVALDFG